MPQDKQRIIENGRGFLEGHTVLLQILRGLRRVPHKGGAAVNERAIYHEETAYQSVFTLSIYNGSGALVQNSTARLGIHDRIFGRAGGQAR